MDPWDLEVAVGRDVDVRESANCKDASLICAQIWETLLAILSGLEVVEPLLMDVGTMFPRTDVGTVLAPKDVADTAWAEETAATRPRPLLAVSQQPVVVPLTEQQKSPSLTAESWHSTTQLASPDTSVSDQRHIDSTLPTRSAERRAVCGLIGTICTATIVVDPRLRHAEPVGKTSLAGFAAEADAACLRIARPIIWEENGVWAAVAVAGL